MIDINLIRQNIARVKSPSGLEIIDRAKGKYQYPKNVRDVIHMLKQRYS